MTQSLGSAGTVHWSAYTWPLHVAWASHSTCLGPETEEPDRALQMQRTRALQESQAEAAQPFMISPQVP